MHHPRLTPGLALRSILLLTAALLGGTAGCKDPGPPATPKAAALAFAKAFKAGDVAAVKATSVGDETSVQVLEVSMTSMNAHRRLAAAAEAQFGKGANVFPIKSSQEGDLVGAVERGQEKVDGDTATVTDATTGQSVRLKKVGKGWMVDRGALTAFAGADFGRVLPKVREMTDTYNNFAAELEAGKYKTANEAKAALAMKLMGGRLGRWTGSQPAKGGGRD